MLGLPDALILARGSEKALIDVSVASLDVISILVTGFKYVQD